MCTRWETPIIIWTIMISNSERWEKWLVYTDFDRFQLHFDLCYISHNSESTWTNLQIVDTSTKFYSGLTPRSSSKRAIINVPNAASCNGWRSTGYDVLVSLDSTLIPLLLAVFGSSCLLVDRMFAGINWFLREYLAIRRGFRRNVGTRIDLHLYVFSLVDWAIVELKACNRYGLISLDDLLNWSVEYILWEQLLFSFKLGTSRMVSTQDAWTYENFEGSLLAECRSIAWECLYSSSSMPSLHALPAMHVWPQRNI